MAPFQNPIPIVTGLKEKIESLTTQSDRLYVGTGAGNLQIYQLPGSDGATAKLIEIKQNLTRRAIEQLDIIKDIHSLVALSDSAVNLYPLPSLAPPTPLAKAKNALSFATHSSVQHLPPVARSNETQPGEFDKAKTVPTMMTYLAIGCSRRVVIYSWKDGEPQDVKEAVLPHSPRAMAFLGHSAICFGYSPGDYAMFSTETMTATPFTLPTVPATSVAGISNMGIGAISGLGGYIGLRAKAKPGVVSISEQEVLVVKDNRGYFYNIQGEQSRPTPVDWPSAPEETGLVKPYLLSVLPAGTVPDPATSGTSTSLIPSAVIQVRSALTSAESQMFIFPFTSTKPSAAPETYALRVVTASPSAKSPLFLVTSPMDRKTEAAEGHSVWQFSLKTWGEQVDELIAAELYDEALGLVNSLDEAVLPDKAQRTMLIRALQAVSKFKSGAYDLAMDTFIELDVNPSKVVALYPEVVAGRLAVSRSEWVSLFGGPVKPDGASTPASSISKDDKPETPSKPGAELAGLGRVASPLGSVRSRFIPNLDALRFSAQKDDDTASISSKRKAPGKDDFSRSVETLLRYLTDRRPKVDGALNALRITPAQSHQRAALSESSVKEIFALPNAPLTALTPEQLLRYAQIVDTALFKSYLVIRPGLLGPLCRVANWCDVSEVEEELRAHEKFKELIDLYNGKKMHDKALNLLRSMSDKEDDHRDKLEPSIAYLQKLGPGYLDQIFKSARWMFDVDSEVALEAFTSEDPELPRQSVANYLEDINPQICARYLEHLTQERDENSPLFHNRLAELYLSMTLSTKKSGDDEAYKRVYGQLLQFIDTTQFYEAARLYGRLPNDDLQEARAILLGRLGRHEHALEIYVYRLQNYIKAEEYCKKVYEPGGATSSIFLSLLRIFLQPTVKTSADLLQPALELISRQSPRLDPVESLNLLPPLVTAKDVREFLMESLRSPVFDTQVVREINKARAQQVARKLMVLESNRVVVTDGRVCPQCHKRLGANSVIAVHAPRGEVTHYQCREAFSRKLKEMRHS